MAKPVYTLSTWESIMAACFFHYDWCRSLTVLFEDRHFCQLMTGGSESGTCEIGEQGGLVGYFWMNQVCK